MKFLIVFALVIVAALAERPSRRVLLARYTTNQQEPQLVPIPISRSRLPRQQLVQQTTTESEQNVTENAEEVDAQFDSKAVQNKPNKKEEEEKSEKLIEGQDEESEEGAYYLYHPSGLLQRVVFSTYNDPAKMAFNAHLQLQNIDPISEPIYTYDPNTFAFQQIHF